MRYVYWLINFLLKETKLMADVDGIKASLSETQASISAIDAKLDVIREKIAALQVGVVTQAQLDEIAALVEAAKVSSAAVAVEAEETAA